MAPAICFTRVFTGNAFASLAGFHTGTLRWIDNPDAETQSIQLRRLNCQDCDDTLGAQCEP